MKKKATQPYEVNYGGLSITVFPSVYAPEYFDDTLWYAKELTKIVENKSLLEIGTGTGFISIVCSKNGARVTATDINSAAVENARLNTERQGLSINVKLSDVYSSLTADEKFDFIFWAHPFNNWDMVVDDMLLKTGIDPNYKSLKRYISESRDHLTPNGKLLLGTGDSADLGEILKIARSCNYRMKLLQESDRSLEHNGDKLIKDLIYVFE